MLNPTLDGIHNRYRFTLVRDNRSGFEIDTDQGFYPELVAWAKEHLEKASVTHSGFKTRFGTIVGSQAYIYCKRDEDAVLIKMRWSDCIVQTEFYDYGYDHIMPEAYEKPRFRTP